ncbi:MAG: sensor histidine kinase [Lachnospiraceae bacterium]|nr:sensor histidine kinase [Lachnospiraceae bacterium]MDD3615735.1 sensor histidine kinase [Lachnospiraceae bacterium]
MRMTRMRNSIQTKGFLVFTVLISTTVLILFVCFITIFGSAYLNQTNDYLSDVTKQATENVDDLVENVNQLSIAVLSNATVQYALEEMNSYEGDISANEKIQSLGAQISNQLRAAVFNEPAVSTVRIYSDYGNEVRISTANQERIESIYTKEDLYELSGGAVWEMSGDEDYLCLSRAILSVTTMKPIGYMTVVCNNEAFSDSLYELSKTYSSKVYILDENQTIVTSNSKEAIGTTLPYSAKEIGERKFRTIVDPETGEQSFYYSGREMSSGWGLVTLVSTRQFMSAIGMIFGILLLLVFAAVAAALLFTRFAVKSLFGPTQQILSGMEQFGQGNLDVRVQLDSKDEFGQIGTAYNQMADNIQNLLEKVLKMEIAQKEAEIEVLKMQINPHFLYNTLDTISWLGIMQGNDDVSDISVSLANLLRANIKNDRMICVKEELETIRDYLRIQSYRFGDKIHVVYEVNPEAEEYKMPNFLLQPLIENAVIHGFEDSQRIEPGELRITIDVDEDGLYFEIADDGKGMDEDELGRLMEECRDMSSHSSIGLKNVYRRLQLMYEDESQFKMESKKNCGTTISFHIPTKREEIKNYESQTKISME